MHFLLKKIHIFLKNFVKNHCPILLLSMKYLRDPNLYQSFKIETSQIRHIFPPQCNWRHMRQLYNNAKDKQKKCFLNFLFKILEIITNSYEIIEIFQNQLVIYKENTKNVRPNIRLGINIQIRRVIFE